jgi:multiple sugar transport system substrate-binding protein
LLLLAVLLQAGCSPLPNLPQATGSALAEATSSPATLPTATQLPPGIIRLQFWVPYPADRPQGILLGELALEFEAANPTVQIELVSKSGYVGLHEAMAAELPDGELPDLGVAFPSMIAQYAQTGMIVPLDAFLADPEVGFAPEEMSDLYPGLLAAGRLPEAGGQLFAFPFVQNAIGMWVNQSLLNEAGWAQPPVTWDQFEQACYDVWAASGTRCYPFVESVSTLAAWIYSRGGEVLDTGGRKTHFGAPAGIESLALLRRLIDAGLAWRPEDTYGDYRQFAEGKAAFAFSSTGNRALYRNAYEGAVQSGTPAFEWRQVLIPQADLEHPATALYGTGFFMTHSEPERERAAWLFVRWFSAREQVARWAEGLEAMPVRASALDVMTDTLQSDPFFGYQVREILPYARPEPAVAGALEVRSLLYTAILSVTQGLADPQTALGQAAQQADALLGAGP